MKRRAYRKRRKDIWPPLWRRRPLLTTAIVLLAVILLAGRLRVLQYVRTDGQVLTTASSDYERYHNRQFTCVRVVDGDTIDIDVPDGKYSTTRIRLWGVDTPETAKSPRGVMYYGPQASAFTKSCVENKRVRLVLIPDDTRGKYGRLLAYVYLDDSETMLNEELITNGFAYADTRFKHPWRKRFIELEKRARKKGVGLWGEVKLEQMPEWRQRYERWKESQ